MSTALWSPLLQLPSQTIAGPNFGTQTVSAGKLVINGANLAASQVVSSTGRNPTGTTSNTSVMMGLGVTGSPTVITPSFSGKVQVTVNGLMSQQTSGDMIFIQASFGTGVPPSNGAAGSGTLIASPAEMTSASASEIRSFSLGPWIVTGLTVATAYWFDLQVRAGTGGAGHTATVSSVSTQLVEVS